MDKKSLSYRFAAINQSLITAQKYQVTKSNGRLKKYFKVFYSRFPGSESLSSIPLRMFFWLFVSLCICLFFSFVHTRKGQLSFFCTAMHPYPIYLQTNRRRCEPQATEEGGNAFSQDLEHRKNLLRNFSFSFGEDKQKQKIPIF